jgi:hypothetical protein
MLTDFEYKVFHQAVNSEKSCKIEKRSPNQISIGAVLLAPFAA